MQLQYGNALRKLELRQKSRGGQGASIEATLTDSHHCEALGIVAIGHAPVLNLCRSLLAAGIDPDTALAVYRDGILSLHIRSIREGAQLTVENGGTGAPKFRLARLARCGAAPSVCFRWDFDPAQGRRP